MKTFYKYLGFLVVAACLYACNKGSLPMGEEEIKVELDQKYIHFDANVATRGTLLNGGSFSSTFAALGYMYPSLWTKEKVTAVPNVFYSDESNKTLAIPQVVNYSDDGYFEYSPLQTWTGKTYSFFAYYPQNNSSVKLFDDGLVKQGEPYITYTLPDSSDPTLLIDVMTASNIDTSIDNPNVQLAFEHRLSAIDLYVRNYCEFDHDNNAETTVKPVTVEITSLQLTFTDIRTKAKIFLDSNTATADLDPENPSIGNRTYEIVGTNTWALSSYPIDKGESVNITGTNTDKPLSILLIPQSDYLKGKLTMVYSKKYQDGDEWKYIVNNVSTTDEQSSFTFNKKLIEGNRYYLDIAFTSDAISVSLDVTEEWTDKEVKHDFE